MIDEKLINFREGRKGWAALRDKLVYKDQAEYLDGDTVPAETRMHMIRQVDRVCRASGYFSYLLSYLDRLISSLPMKQGTPIKILDVGFGGGGMLEAIFRHLSAKKIAVELHGIELAGDLVTGVRARLDGLGIPVTLVQGDGCRLGFADHQFDIVYSNYTVHHLRRADQVVDFFGELSRVGRAGFVADLDRRLTTPFYCAMIGLFGTSWPVVSDGIRSARRAYSAEEIDFLFAVSGRPASRALGKCEPRRSLPHWIVKWGPLVNSHNFLFRLNK